MTADYNSDAKKADREKRRRKKTGNRTIEDILTDNIPWIMSMAKNIFIVLIIALLGTNVSYIIEERFNPNLDFKFPSDLKNAPYSNNPYGPYKTSSAPYNWGGGIGGQPNNIGEQISSFFGHGFATIMAYQRFIVKKLLKYLQGVNCSSCIEGPPKNHVTGTLKCKVEGSSNQYCSTGVGFWLGAFGSLITMTLAWPISTIGFIIGGTSSKGHLLTKVILMVILFITQVLLLFIPMVVGSILFFATAFVFLQPSWNSKPGGKQYKKNILSSKSFGLMILFMLLTVKSTSDFLGPKEAMVAALSCIIATYGVSKL
jgi:hypothetical protein